MSGYWIIWCIAIVAILYFSGFKSVMSNYLSKYEMIVLVVLLLLFACKGNRVLFISETNDVIIFSTIIIATILVCFSILRNIRNNIVEMLLASGLLGLVYCLYYTLFLIFRGFEPTMVEWIIYVVILAIVLVLVLEKNQMLSAIIIAQAIGQSLLHWHQQGQYSIIMGNIEWWDFVCFSFVCTLCLYESIEYVVKKVILFTKSKMKS